jgi:hypothetical protein
LLQNWLAGSRYLNETVRNVANLHQLIEVQWHKNHLHSLGLSSLGGSTEVEQKFEDAHETIFFCHIFDNIFDLPNKLKK